VRASLKRPEDDALVAELRSVLAEAGEIEALAARMGLLADPRRLQILFCLHAHPGVRSSDLARAIEAHESTTSHALAVLREAGWVRARRTGILGLEVSLGQRVVEGERLGELHDSFGRRLAIVKADRDGIVIGRTEAPLVNSGDALVHIASSDPEKEPEGAEVPVIG